MRVLFQIIWGTVVLIMRRYPPGTAQANQKADAESDDFIAPRGTEDTPMASIMAYIPDLTEHKSQERGVGQH